MKQVTEIKYHLGIIDTLKQELLDQCPVKVGDIIPVEGFSYKGKNIKVGSINISINQNSYTGKPSIKWLFIGYVLKKDGTEGSIRCSFKKEID